MHVLTRVVLLNLFAVAWILSGSAPVSAQGQLPAKIDLAKSYLIYMHGGWPEMHGQSREHPKYGKRHEFDEILDAFRAKGL